MVKDYLIDRSNNRVVEISGINVLYTNQFCFNSNPIQVLGYNNNNPWISLPETDRTLCPSGTYAELHHLLHKH